MLTQLTSFASIGLEAQRITVEVGMTRGDSKVTIVGLGDTAVKESQQRVFLAIRNMGYRWPTGRVITVNLAPADLRKVGPRYDLPIAIGILATGDLISLPQDVLEDTAFLGELALDGTLRHVSGVLPTALTCKKMGIKTLVVPEENGPEAALVPGVRVVAAKNLKEVLDVLLGLREETAVDPPVQRPASADFIDFADVRGQEHAKRALEIAAAGGHNVLLSGAPGAGKTLLARALRGILPPLNEEESIEVTGIYSIANRLPDSGTLLPDRPFRVVHHTASGVSIVGGGQVPGPGEITLAHKGVLFLDELAEFPTQVLEVLRQPLEDRSITITRAHGSVTFPADFILVAAMNPPEYSGGNASRVQKKISPPLLDRIDLKIDVQPVPVEDLKKAPKEGTETTADILQRVRGARLLQQKRFASASPGLSTNSEMSVKHIDTLCTLDAKSTELLSQAANRLGLSARGYHRTIKVARTIADLAGSTQIAPPHIAEALQYRQSCGME